tara:strand:+ start:3210 stop:3860 length:651 start_codon:yes stop_codon:yes gene_type:complete
MDKTRINKNEYNQTIIEELANSFTHGFGFILSIIGFIILISISIQSGDIWRLSSYIIYGISLTILYLFSTIYHSVSSSRIKSIFRKLDHSAIYLLIAGTYTPVILISLRTTWVVFLLPIIWIMAIIGIYIKSFNIDKYEKLSLFFYIFMGWLSLIAIKPLINSVPIEAFILILIGGISYTFGVVFYLWRHLPFQHAIWHMFVLIGSILHYIGILYI